MTTTTNTETYNNYINNAWVETESEKLITSINPATKEAMGYVQSSTEQELNKAVDAAYNAKKVWRKLGQAARGQLLFKTASILEENLNEIAESMTKEMGKTLTEAKGETARGIAILRYYAAEGMRKDGDVIPSSDSEALMFTKRTPLGVVGVITPWNFPVAIPIWKIAPALVYGNTIVFKPASEAAVTAAKVVECFAKAGFPEGVFNFITGSGSTIGQNLIDHPKLDAITFTGSEQVGQNVAKSAAARGIKFQLEMGGKNPAIVTKTANIDQAVQAVISGAFKSSGQKCTATSRVVVEESVYEEFKQKLVEATKKITVGNSLEEDVWMGPSASEGQFNTFNEYVEKGKQEGAKLIQGGEVLTGGSYDNGFFVTPAIFDEATADMAISQEEIFGPFIALIKAADFEEAISLANNTKYGLSASIFTSDINSILEFIDEIEVGLVRINAESAGVELQAPFGGMKGSSSGSREQGEAAKEFYTAIKTVFIKGT